MQNNIHRDEGFFNARDRLRLFWRSATPAEPANAKAHVFLVHGYADHCGRYDEFLERLPRHGYAVHAFDCRGHGQSDGRRGHCDAFGQYLEDLEVFFGLTRTRSSVGDRRVFVVGHSHGGLVVARWGLGRPQGVAGVVLTCPYFRLALRPSLVKVALAKAIGRVVPFLPVKNELDPVMFSHDVEWQKATERDALYNRVTTPRWFSESTKAQEEVLRRASEYTLPTLILTAGADPVTATPASREFFERITAKDKQYKEYPGMLHEILHETDRDSVYADLVGWLDARV